MENSIRDAISRSLKELKNVQDRVEEFIDDLPDDTEEIKKTTKSLLGQINSVLNKAVEQAGDKAEEAQLQAHLGIMEAKDKLDASKIILDDVLGKSTEASEKFLNEAELKRHLAMMEAKEFWEERGSKFAEEFQASASTMQEAATKAASDLSGVLNEWNEQFKSRK
ncbi:MAG: ElaB/YqjD/DUF883 family membrane-anchored ribosome-binding protein [Granulosicoccus sp.]|jgi:ElaB/YqjD/DUF883 family membrane-anchored ribosome-binding protein